MYQQARVITKSIYHADLLLDRLTIDLAILVQSFYIYIPVSNYS